MSEELQESGKHIDTIKRDFAKRYKASETLLGMIRNDLGELGQLTYELIGLMTKKHEILQNFQKNRRKSVPASSFALADNSPTNDNADVSDLREIDTKIEECKEHMKIVESNHLEPHLVQLRSSTSKVKEHIDQLEDAYSAIFNNIVK